METIFVGIGEFKVTKGAALLESISLGSCIGIALYDPLEKVAGLAHVMLPNSSLSSIATSGTPAKFVDKAIYAMLDDMTKMGANKSRIIAKMSGGAYMFQSAMPDPAMNIGERNIEATREILAKERIPILSEDTGKNYGRTLRFDPSTGMLTVKSAKFGVKEI